MKTVQEHRQFLEEYYEKIKDLPLPQRINRLVKYYPASQKYFDLFLKSNIFCTAPWLGLNIHPAGRLFPCCAFDQNQHLGHLKYETIQEFRSGRALNEIKNAILNNQPVDGCKSCYSSDETGGENLKTHLKNIHEKYIPLLSLGERLPLLYLDVQFSNLCNLRCRICGPVFSSSWIKDHAKLYGENAEMKIHSIKREYSEKWDSVLDIIESVDEVYFWGGEPLLMPEHTEFLRRLIQHGKTDVKLRYSTNFSELDFGNSNIIELWKQFKNLSIGASLDGSYERGEYMRKGLDWNQVVENRRRLMLEIPHARFFIACATSAYNILHLPDFFKEWIQLGYVHANDFCVNLLLAPEKLSVQTLSAENKRKATQKIEKLIADLIRPRFGPNSIAEQRFQAAINHMNARDLSHLKEEFIQYNKSLDEIREENFRQVFPELDL